ncbi:hypothetical protein SDC9_83528 [bioreactor metagenome]|uniref:Uncharacterized protein n=1 Tax=bioreactor metagenome TaxID=1076179 RepID=A0A644ZGE5_9ZZZZ
MYCGGILTNHEIPEVGTQPSDKMECIKPFREYFVKNQQCIGVFPGEHVVGHAEVIVVIQYIE